MCECWIANVRQSRPIRRGQHLAMVAFRGVEQLISPPSEKARAHEHSFGICGDGWKSDASALKRDHSRSPDRVAQPHKQHDAWRAYRWEIEAEDPVLLQNRIDCFSYSARYRCCPYFFPFLPTPSLPRH